MSLLYFRQVSLRRQEIADRLNAWTIFNGKNKEFCDWLTQMENKVCHSEDLSIEEMVEKLKKVWSHGNFIPLLFAPFSSKEPQIWDRNLEFDYGIFIKNTWSQVAGNLQNILSRLNKRNFNNFYSLKVKKKSVCNLLRSSWKVDLLL